MSAYPDDTSNPTPIVVDPDEIAESVAYQRGKIDGYAECFADFRRIVRDHGLEFSQFAKPSLSFTERRFIARASGRNVTKNS